MRSLPYNSLPSIDGIQLTIKRGDCVNTEGSGNKYWKLKYNLQQAMDEKALGLLTFGGAFSNHLAATAAACARSGLQSVGVVRGEEWADPQKKNPTLEFCKQKGMQLHFLSRSAYRNKNSTELQKTLQQQYPNFMLLPEGGTNALAVKGCAEVLTTADHKYDTICVAVGTGGTLAGLATGSTEHQQLLGFMSLRDTGMAERITPYTTTSNWQLIHDYTFGGYAKTPEALIAFINNFKKKFKIPLEPLYTGKMLFGIFDLIKTGQWRWGKNVLIIHTGGLQGVAGINQRLAKKGQPLLL